MKKHQQRKGSKRTIAVVDDHPVILEGLRTLLSKMGKYELVLASTDGAEFIAQLQGRPSPDLALVDLSMPGTDGFAVIAWLHEQHPTTRISAYSGFMSGVWVARAIAAGAHSFTEKISNVEQLGFVLDQLMEHGIFHNEIVRASLAANEGHAMRLAELNIPEREMRFLRLICEHPDDTNEGIAVRLGKTTHTVDDCVRTLRELLNLHSRAALVAWALGNGLFPDLEAGVERSLAEG